MKGISDLARKKLDIATKSVLILLIIVLLIHNCVLREKSNTKLTPNGNIDIIEIKCDDNQCEPVSKPTDDLDNKSNDKKITSLSFAQDNISIKKGNKSKLIVLVNPSSLASTKFTWKSSDESIATIDNNGIITGLKEGKIVVTVMSANGVYARCIVNIVSDTINAEKIILNTDKLELGIGETIQIPIIIEPSNATERDIIWSSSNETIATVDENGVVKGLKTGTTTITAKTKDGKVQATIIITVNSEYSGGEVVAYDNDKTPVTWNGSNELNIFSKSIYNIDGVIAPESENTYQFIIKNDTEYKIKYNVAFIETNNYHINMKYKLKKNESYLINNYSKASDLSIYEHILNPGENDTYYLDWKWISSSNDTEIGSNPEAKYGLKIEVKAESING